MGTGARSWWLDGQVDSLRKKGRRLISQYAILPHLCPPPHAAHPLPPIVPLLVGSLPSLPSSVPPLPPHSCITPISFLWASHCPIPHPPHIPPLQPNALFSLNALFLLTSCLHPSQWPCITPGRIITLGRSVSSVAPCSALSALSIYGVSPFVASHLPRVQ